jgi:hypothetical protein
MAGLNVGMGMHVDTGIEAQQHRLWGHVAGSYASEYLELVKIVDDDTAGAPGKRLLELGRWLGISVQMDGLKVDTCSARYGQLAE